MQKDTQRTYKNWAENNETVNIKQRPPKSDKY